MSTLSTLQNNKIREHVKSTFYNNSPTLIIMDYGGRCWGIDEQQFDHFYHSDNARIYYDTNNNSYDRGDSSSYRKFGGWNKHTDDCLWSGCNERCGLTGLLDLNNYNGYNSRKSPNTCPSRSADGNNYYSQDDKNRFDKNRKKRIFPWDGNGDNPPNAIPGYYRISRNDNDVNNQTWVVKDKNGTNICFPGAGFVTLHRPGGVYDLAFILFVKYTDTNEFTNDIMDNHSILVNNILNDHYSIKKLSQCININTNLNYDNDWNTNFEWLYNNEESKESTLQHVKSDSCLKLTNDNANTKSQITKTAVCANDLDFSWRKKGDMVTKVVGHNQVKCMDSNGTRVYLNNCNSNNIYQKWSFEGRKIIHKQSGKCLTVGSDYNAKLVDCSCKIDLDNNTNDFRTKYIDLVKQKYNICKNKQNLNYNNIDDCNVLLNNDDSISIKFVNWCIDNDKDVQVNDYCIDALQNTNKYLDIYNLKECSKKSNIMDKPYCSSFLKKKIEDKEKELYNKITYDTILTNWCANNNKFITGDENFKYTEDPYDKDCLNNWTYYAGDGKTIIGENIFNITTLNNTKNWCATRRNSDENYRCNYLNSRNAYMNKDNYNELNIYWKKTGCMAELPIPLFLKIMNMEIDEQKKYLKINFINNKSFYSRNICYTGDSLENNTIMLPAQSLYSQNKKYKLSLTENGDLITHNLLNNVITKLNTISDNTSSSKLSMQMDGNLVLYNRNGAYWSSNTFTKNTFGVIRNDGQFVLYSRDGKIVKNLSTSSFDNDKNNECNNLEDNIDNLEDNTYNTTLFILFIILFTLIIMLLKSKIRCKDNIYNKINYNINLVKK